MSRRITWSVAAGATVLFALTGCTQQISGASAIQSAGQGRSLCSIVTEPVSKALEQAGITSVAPNAGGGSTCTWTDSQSGTSVTLAMVAEQLPEKDAAKDAETTAVPGAGAVTIVGPKEVRFTVDGRQFQLLVESDGPVDPSVLFRVLTAVSSALAGQGAALPAAPAQQAGDSEAPAGKGAGASTAVGDSTITVTDDKDRSVALRNSSGRVLGDEEIGLDNGQSVPLRTIATIGAKQTSTGTALDITLVDGNKVSGAISNALTFTGDSDAGYYSLYFKNITKVQFQRDLPFVATPDPKVGPWTAATVRVTAEDGTSHTVSATSFRALGDEQIGLDTGLQVPLQRIAKVEATHGSTGTDLEITLTNGKQVSGSISDAIEFSGDAPGGAPFKVYAEKVRTIDIKH
jgi:hypothetical protein